MKVCMFVYNAFAPDARVLREAQALRTAGHEVRVVAVLDRRTVRAEVTDGVKVTRIERDPPHYKLLRRSRRVRRFVRLGRARSRRRIRRTRLRVLRRQRLLRIRVAKRLGFRGERYRRAVGPLRPAPSKPAADRAPEGSPEPGQLRHAGKRVAGMPRRTLMWFHKPLMFLDYYARAYRLVRHDSIGAFHAHDLNTLPVAAALAKATRARLIYDAHELYTEMSTLSRKERLVWKIVERALIGRADEIVTVCESIAGELEERYGVPRPTLVLNCPSNPAPPQPLDHGLLAHKAGVEDRDIPIVLYQGGFTPHRGLPELVMAARGFDRAQLVFMGWGPLEEELRRLIASEGLEERVRITGGVPSDELVRYTSGAALGVIPYQPVGLNNLYSTPNKLFEYMAAGIPVAGSRLPELVRFIEGFGIGQTFDPWNPGEISTAVNAILADRMSGDAMAVRAREAGRRFTWENESTKLLGLYSGAS